MIPVAIYLGLAIAIIYFAIYTIQLPKALHVDGSSFVAGAAFYSVLYGAGIGLIIDGLLRIYSSDVPNTLGVTNVAIGYVVLQLLRRGVFAKLPLVGRTFASFYVPMTRWSIQQAKRRSARVAKMFGFGDGNDERGS